MENKRKTATNSQQLFKALFDYYVSIKYDDVVLGGLVETLTAVDSIVWLYDKPEPQSKSVINFKLKSFFLIFRILQQVPDTHNDCELQTQYSVNPWGYSNRKPREKKCWKFATLGAHSTYTIPFLQEATRTAGLSNHNSTFIYHLLAVMAIRIATGQGLLHNTANSPSDDISRLPNAPLRQLLEETHWSPLRQLLKEIRGYKCPVCLREIETQKFCLRDSCNHLVCKECTQTLIEKRNDT